MHRPLVIYVITDFCLKNGMDFKWEGSNLADK